jgi:hypothetical protein
MICRVLLCSFVLLLSACGTRGLVNADSQKTQPPTKLLVAPADFIIHEIGFGKDQERVVVWEEKASNSFEATVRSMSDSEGRFNLVSFSTLSPDDQAVIEQHRALFATMTAQLLQIKEGNVGVWTEKRKNFNYSMGTGLRPIKENYGADAVVFVVGKDTVRSAGRIMLDMINSVIPGADSLSASNAYLVVGVVETETGQILLFDTDVAKRKSFSNESDVRDMANNTLTDYKKLVRASR